MRYLRATVLIGGLVVAVVLALQAAGLLLPWELAFRAFAGAAPEPGPIVPPWVVVALCALAAVAIAWTTVDIPKPALKAAVAAIALFQAGTAACVLALFGIPFPVVPVAISVALAFLGGMLYSRSEGGRRKRILRAALATRVSRANFQRLVDRTEPFPFQGARAEVVVLVCEWAAAGTEDTAPVAGQVGAINAALGRASALLMAHGGYLEECGGGGLRALFADSITPGDPAVAAAGAALALAREPAPPGGDFHIGLEMDEALVGVFGAGQLGAFGAHGPALDFARRLARWNRRFGTRILAGPGLFGATAETVVFRPAALVSPPLCTPAAEIYEPLAMAGDPASEPARESRSLFWEGVVLFREARWHEALARLSRARELTGPDPLCDFYLARARAALGGDAAAAEVVPGEKV